MTDRLKRAPDADVHVPSVGSTRVPFSWCRIHILVVDYRWGSMGSDETAITIPGALEKLTFFTGTGRHRVQIIYFFWMQVAPRALSGVGLVVSCRPRRIRHRCDSLVLPRALEANHGQKMAKPSGLLREIDQK